MVEAKLTATVANRHFGNIEFEFGRFQAEMNISDRGDVARKLKLKAGDKVEVIIRKK